MTLEVKQVDYYNTTVYGNVTEGFKLLSMFADVGINLLAFKAIPVGSKQTQFTLVPDDSSKMSMGAKNAGLEIDGPYSAILVKGYGDEPGECAMVHEKLAQAGVHVTESSGIADIKDSYGIILYIQQEDRKSDVCFEKLNSASAEPSHGSRNTYRGEGVPASQPIPVSQPRKKP